MGGKVPSEGDTGPHGGPAESHLTFETQKMEPLRNRVLFILFGDKVEYEKVPPSFYKTSIILIT